MVHGHGYYMDIDTLGIPGCMPQWSYAPCMCVYLCCGHHWTRLVKENMNKHCEPKLCLFALSSPIQSNPIPSNPPSLYLLSFFRLSAFVDRRFSFCFFSFFLSLSLSSTFIIISFPILPPPSISYFLFFYYHHLHLSHHSLLFSSLLHTFLYNIPIISPSLPAH